MLRQTVSRPFHSALKWLACLVALAAELALAAYFVPRLLLAPPDRSISGSDVTAGGATASKDDGRRSRDTETLVTLRPPQSRGPASSRPPQKPVRGGAAAAVQGAGTTGMPKVTSRPSQDSNPPSGRPFQKLARGGAAEAMHWNDTIIVLSDGGKTPPASALSQLGDCALVGSSAAMVGSGLGRAIDEHTTVIRVNRLPRPMHRADFGGRTDIYFANNQFIQYMWNWFNPKTAAQFIGEKSHVDCATPSNCPFPVIVLQNELKVKKSQWEQVAKKWQQLPFTVARQSNDVALAGECFPALKSKAAYAGASGGFRALLTFLPLCASMHLYGFTGSASADGHPLGEWHNFNAEHELLRRMAAGSLRSGEFSPKACGAAGRPSRLLGWFQSEMAAYIGRRPIEVVIPKNITYVDGPRVSNSAWQPHCSTWLGTQQEAEMLCRANESCAVLHDWNCDGRGWRFCTGTIQQIQAVSTGSESCTMLEEEA